MPADRLPADFFQGAEHARPYAQESVSSFTGNDYLKRLVEYSGYLRVTEPGLYQFRLDPAGANRLLIGGVQVVHNGLNAPRAPGRVHLQPGLHALSLRIGLGKSTCEMLAPGRTAFEAVAQADLLRPAGVQPLPANERLIARLEFEDLAEGRTTVQAESGTIAQVLFGALADGGHAGKGLQLSVDKGKLEVSGLKMLEDAATVAAWVKRQRVTDAHLLTAPGKFTVRLRGNNFVAAYERSPDLAQAGGGDAVAPGKWFHVAATFGDEICLYLNGQRIADTQVDRTAITHGANARAETITMTGSMPAVIDDLRVYNRVLSAEEVCHVYQEH
jgi:hypothetical protein